MKRTFRRFVEEVRSLIPYRRKIPNNGANCARTITDKTLKAAVENAIGVKTSAMKRPTFWDNEIIVVRPHVLVKDIVFTKAS